MIVCFCADITKKQIVKAFYGDTLAELYEIGMAQNCGGCHFDIQDLLEMLKEKHEGC